MRKGDIEEAGEEEVSNDERERDTDRERETQIERETESEREEAWHVINSMCASQKWRSLEPIIFDSVQNRQ